MPRQKFEILEEPELTEEDIDNNPDLTEEQKQEQKENLRQYREAILGEKRKDHVIYLLSIIGEIEGHDCLPSTSKTTKYEHVLPKLATIEDDNNIDGVLLLLNTMGGDVTKEFYTGDMQADVKWWAKGRERYSSLSFDIIER